MRGWCYGDMTLSGTYVASPSRRAAEQVELYERSEGREGTTMRGMPVVVLTTRGARTGNIRKTPLMRVEHEGDYAVVASQGGAPTHPKWYYNLLAHPEVQLQDGPAKQDMVARELDGEEREIWWKRAVEAFPDYADYQTKTQRIIPVFVLEPKA